MHLWWSNVCACFLGMHKTKQIVVSHSRTAAEIISLAAGFSMESIFVLTFWDHVVTALELLSLVQQEVTPCILVESRHVMQWYFVFGKLRQRHLDLDHNSTVEQWLGTLCHCTRPDTRCCWCRQTMCSSRSFCTFQSQSGFLANVTNTTQCEKDSFFHLENCLQEID